MIFNANQCHLVKTLVGDTGNVESIPCSAKDFLCELSQVTWSQRVKGMLAPNSN